MAPILPLTVMTIPMIVLPRTHAPIAIFQLRPTAMMEEAAPQRFQNRRSFSDSTDESHRGELTDFPVRDSPGVGHPVGDVRAPVPCAL